LGTTIYDKDINYLKNTYWKRWKIEIHFRYSKYNLSLKELKSKTENSIRQDIFIHHFIFIVSSHFQYMLQENIKKGYKINTSNQLDTTINNLLYLFLYNKATNKNIYEIERILNICKENIIEDKKNITNPRITKRPKNRWDINGNRYQ